MGIIIRDLSTHGLFQNDMILAAGFGGLSREISYVSVIDTPLVPKPSYRLEDGVFVLSSFFLYNDNPQLLLEAIKNLANMGAAAVGIKTDLYIHEIPKCVLDYCNEIDFPLFQVNNKDLPFRKIISVIEDIIRRHDDDSEFFDGILRGDIETMYYKAARENMPVNFVCLTTGRDIIVKYCPNPQPEKSYLISRARDFLASSNIFSDLSITESYIKDGNTYVFPCHVYNILEEIMVFEYPDELSAYQIRRIKYLNSLLSLQIMESILQEKGREDARLDQAREYLLCSYPDEDTARIKFETLGFPIKADYRLMLFTCDDFSSSCSYYHRLKAEAAVTQQITLLFPNSICFSTSPYLVFVVPMQPDTRFVSDRAFEGALTSLLTEGLHLEGHRVKFSPVQQSLSRISIIYRHLLQTAKISASLNLESIQLIADFDAVSIVSALISSNQHLLLRESVINPVIMFDSKYKSNLWGTLSECLSTDKIEQAAVNLHIHSSTLRYRLQKIENLTGYNYFNLHGKIVLYCAWLLYMTD